MQLTSNCNERLRTNEATVKLGKLLLTSLRQPLPPSCDVYIAAVRTMPRQAPGWLWNERIADLGPPPDLHARARAWRSDWERHWAEYVREYREWMAQEPCAGLLAAVEYRIKVGQTVALACWCDEWSNCHRTLIGYEMAGRGVLVAWLRRPRKNPTTEAG
jgi:Protein of unknown function, DUF488